MSMSMSNINEISWHLVIPGLGLHCTWKDDTLHHCLNRNSLLKGRNRVTACFVKASFSIGASLWVPVDFDFFAHFPSNRRFFRRNRRILVSRIALRGNVVASSAQPAAQRQ